MKNRQKKSPGGKAGAKVYSRSDQSVAQASPLPIGVPAVVSYVYYYMDVHGRLVRTSAPPGRDNVQTKVLDLGGGTIVEELRIIEHFSMTRAVLNARDGAPWVRYAHPDDAECEYWRRPHREGGAS